MATKTSIPPRKAPTVLAIRNRHTLMRLPPELRDLIYYYVLVEPSKWDKNHAATCSYHDRDAAAIPPPYTLDDTRPRCTVSEDDNSRQQACHEQCIRRKGLALLRTSRQIHQEADGLFWAENTMCFDPEQSFYLEIMGLPEETRGKIRRLSLGARCKAVGGLSERFISETSLREAVGSLPALTHLELPVSQAWNRNDWLFTQSGPLKLTLVEHTSTMFDFGRGTMVAYLSYAYKIPDLRCSALELEGRPWWHISRCKTCKEQMEEARKPVGQSRVAEFDGRLDLDWKYVVRCKFQTLEPGCPDNSRYIIQLKMIDGTTRAVYVRGLPLESTRERQKRMRKAMNAPRRVGRTENVKSGDRSELNTWGAKHHGGGNRYIETTREQKATDRVNAVEVRKQHAATREGSEWKVAVKSRADSEREVAGEKKAALKRSAKRSVGDLG